MVPSVVASAVSRETLRASVPTSVAVVSVPDPAALEVVFAFGAAST